MVLCRFRDEGTSFKKCAQPRSESVLAYDGPTLYHLVLRRVIYPLYNGIYPIAEDVQKRQSRRYDQHSRNQYHSNQIRQEAYNKYDLLVDKLLASILTYSPKCPLRLNCCILAATPA